MPYVYPDESSIWQGRPMWATIAVYQLVRLSERLDPVLYEDVLAAVRPIRHHFWAIGRPFWCWRNRDRTSELLTDLKASIEEAGLNGEWLSLHRHLENFDTAATHREVWADEAIAEALEYFLNWAVLDEFLGAFIPRADDIRRNAFAGDEAPWTELMKTSTAYIVASLRTFIVYQFGSAILIDPETAEETEGPLVPKVRTIVQQLVAHTRLQYNAFGRQEALRAFRAGFVRLFYGAEFAPADMDSADPLNPTFTVTVERVSTAVPRAPDAECPICKESNHREWRRIDVCGHVFGRECLQSQLDCGLPHRYRCAMCRRGFSAN